MSDAYEIGWQVILSPLKFVTLVMLLLILGIIIYSGYDKENVDYYEVEGNEVINNALNCILENSKLNEEKLNLNYISSCLKVNKYGVRVKYENKEVVVNDEIYSSYAGFCGRVASCSSFTFKDLNGKLINIMAVFKKNE